MAKHRKPNPILETVKAAVTLPFAIVLLGATALMNN